MVPEYVAPLDEDAVQTAAFELLFAFDEVISLGYKEHVTVQQARPLPCRGPGQTCTTWLPFPSAHTSELL